MLTQTIWGMFHWNWSNFRFWPPVQIWNDLWPTTFCYLKTTHRRCVKLHTFEIIQTRVETAAYSVWLQMNDSKTQFMAYSIKEDVTLVTKTGSHLEQVKDFQYLGSWVDESEKKTLRFARPLPGKHAKNAHTLEVSPACLLEDQLLSCRRRKYISE